MWRHARLCGGLGIGVASLAGLVNGDKQCISCSSFDDVESINVAEMKKTIQELKERNQLLADKISPVEPTVQEKEYILRNTKKTIAIFGGSFDPITNAHLTSACEILHHRKADEVWLVPCGPRADKPSLKTPAIHRLIMCHLAVNSSFGSTFPMKVNDIEIREGRALSTYELMSRLTDEHPDYNFVFVVGSDLIGQIREWTDPVIEDHGEKLWNECAFLGLHRPGHTQDFAELPPNFRWLDDFSSGNQKIVTQELSSSEIRGRMGIKDSQKFGEYERAKMTARNFRKIEGLMPAAVVAHILRNDLYKQ
jgi:nicotinate (nicotinamide) nucleotide adenylyltransferase